MTQWMVAVGPEQFRSERLYQHDQLEVPLPAVLPMAAGDPVALVTSGGTAGEPVVFGLARVVTPPYPIDRVPDDPDDDDAGLPAAMVVEYLSRAVDRPVPLADLALPDAMEFEAGDPAVLGEPAYGRIVEALGPRPSPVAPKREWLVSLDLPIEADSPAEAVRIFWTYVRQLGPAELPAFVSPRGDETAMRPYVLGAEHEMDPEEDE
ncbi:hypothetical protein Athai_51390 [Actinocatenispora thailandica]|uniref:Uncharacterized protein n=1 Tax=Actinocatenispora thailandica TaxID=227318 RepID=A0A7R7DTU7_9ACTN|nr:hypothetical protein [Actinocatenispora thailandica]BCJ37636.1 hypothetical protein Athai_51390 [Actinocatenispora thailandica]